MEVDKKTMVNYEPPTKKEGAPLGFDLEVIAPGVRGYAIESEGKIYIPFIMAERPGNGDMGRFVDSLSDRCVFVNVLSSTLMKMLIKRGWKRKMELLNGETVDVWSR